jgi:hypothetical protein
MARKKAGKASSKKPSESLEMFDSLFKGNLEMEERQANRDKAVWAKEELSESNEMFDSIFRDDLSDKDKERPPAKKKPRKSKPSELPPWKRPEKKGARKSKKSRPKKKKSARRARVALLLLLLTLLAGAGLHYYGVADFGPYAAHLKDLKTEALSLYAGFAGKEKAGTETIENPAIKKRIPIKPASQPATVKHEAPIKPQPPADKAPVEKPKPASPAPPAVSEKKASATAPSSAATAAVKRPGRDARPAVPAAGAKTPSKSTAKKPVSFPYSVYLGSYSKADYLKKAMKAYDEKGLFPFWVKVDLGEKGVWHRVFAGCFQTRAEADAFIKEKAISEGESRLVRYSNLIGTYASGKALQDRRAALVKRGYSPYVVPGGQDVYRLYVGAFRKKPFSEALKAELAADGIQSQIVAR